MTTIAQILFFIFGLVLVYIGLYVYDHKAQSREDAIEISACTCSMFGFILVGLMFINFIDSPNCLKPTALDVYRGKTSLQITHKDTVPFDSIVIWK